MRTLEDETAGVPDTELPWVWVSAGVLSYRPCERRYECEDCPLYQALRQGAGEGAGGALPAGETAADNRDDRAPRALAGRGAGCTLHLDRAYSAQGLWLAEQPDGTIRVGMDDYTLRLLQPVDDVARPPPDSAARAAVGRGRGCAFLSHGCRACGRAGDGALVVRGKAARIARHGAGPVPQRSAAHLVPGAGAGGARAAERGERAARRRRRPRAQRR